MAKKHIITFQGTPYALDSITAANQALAVLSKLVPVEHVTDSDDIDEWHYKPRTGYRSELDLSL